MSGEQVQSQSDERTINNDPNVMRHNYRVLNEQEKADIVDIKDAGMAFIRTLDRFPTTREVAIARTKVEEAVMWAVKSITK